MRRFLQPLLLGLLAASLAACGPGGPQDTLTPEGPVARQVDALFKPVFWIAVGVFVIVEGLIVYALFRFRERRGQTEEPRQTHGNAKAEFGWTLAPALLMAGIAIPTIYMIFDLDPKPTPDVLRVKVVGHQWWWEYRYETYDPPIVTANELVIPTGRQVYLDLESVDVIHSFWVPKLAGKQDVVPGRTNNLQFSAEKPGTYEGQCAEFCALSHAYMRLRVVAKTQTEFESWARDQQKPVRATAGDVAAGRELFLSNACIGCHTIDGLRGASGTQGPNLTHLASRSCFAGCTLEMTEQELFDWVKDAPSMKPMDPDLGLGMPSFKTQLSDDEVRQIVAFLRSLR